MMSKKIVSGRSNIHKVNREKRPEFDEIAIYFSKEEWESLEEEQKALYKDVIMDNFRTLQSLGTINCKPPVVMKIEQGEEPYVTGYQHVNDNEHLIDTRKVFL
ncbi:zinc finger protein 707-like [Bombina bombina]|uniref:zinc finger protein 707-like n=1 Tax=Bombina bombina TaxID=8345 RepID=UPI00235B2832|nr:zinc finger protein 707-like [Bombina bombina]